MKNTLILIAVVVVFFGLIKEGERSADYDSEKMNIGDKLKLGFQSTLNSIMNKSSNTAPANTDSFQGWKPRFVGDMPSDDMLVSYVSRNPFSQDVLKPRGSFLNPKYCGYQSAYKN
jgi:hypothetical protein